MRKKMERLAKKVVALHPGNLYFTDVFPGGNIEHSGKYFLVWASGAICRAWKHNGKLLKRWKIFFQQALCKNR